MVEELTSHSRFVRFIWRCRAFFLNEFAKYRNEFSGFDGESLFVGTVFHSLDHSSVEQIIEDPLWLDVNCSKFGKMAEISRIIRVGFVPDLYGLTFHKQVKVSLLLFH